MCIICVCTLRLLFVAFSLLKEYKEAAVGVMAQPLVLYASDEEISSESCEIKSFN